jgi:hypothetical protein
MMAWDADQFARAVLPINSSPERNKNPANTAR